MDIYFYVIAFRRGRRFRYFAQRTAATAVAAMSRSG